MAADISSGLIRFEGGPLHNQLRQVATWHPCIQIPVAPPMPMEIEAGEVANVMWESHTYVLRRCWSGYMHGHRHGDPAIYYLYVSEGLHELPGDVEFPQPVDLGFEFAQQLAGWLVPTAKSRSRGSHRSRRSP